MAATDGSVVTVAIQYRLLPPEPRNAPTATADGARDSVRRRVEQYVEAACDGNGTDGTAAARYFTTHLTGYEYLLGVPSAVAPRGTRWRGAGALVGGVGLLALLWCLRRGCLGRSTLPLPTFLVAIVSISASWAITMALWYILAMASAEIMSYDEASYLEQLIVIPSLAWIGCIGSSLLFKDRLEKQMKREHWVAWIAGTGSIWIISSAFSTPSVGASVAVLLALVYTVQAGILPKLGLPEAHGEPLLPPPVSSPNHLTALIATTSDVCHDHRSGLDRIDENEADNYNLIDLEQSSPEPRLTLLVHRQQCRLEELPRQSMWLALSKTVLLHPSRGLLVGGLLLHLAWWSPMGMWPWNLAVTASFDSFFPRTGVARDELTTWNLVRDRLHRPGHVAPFRLVFDGRAANMSMTKSVKAFEVMHIVVDELMATEQDNMDGSGGSTGVAGYQGSTHMGMTANEARELAQHIKAIVKGEFDTEESCEDQDKVMSRSLADSGHEALLANAVPNRRLYVHHQRTLYNGIAVMHNTRLPFSVYSTAKYCNKVKPWCPYELLHAINVIDELCTSPDAFTTVVYAELGLDPLSEEATRWLVSARSTIGKLEDSGVLNGIQVTILGAAANEHDTKAVQQALAFTSMWIVFAFIIIFTGIHCQSLFVGLMSSFTIVLTLRLAFGITNIIFRQSEIDVNWRLPPMVSLIIICHSLANHFSFMSDFLDSRNKVYGNGKSIAAALNTASSRLLATGTATVLVFVGYLSFSSIPCLRQCSILIAVAAGVDSLLSRILFTPIAMNVCGPAICWWPQSPPTFTSSQRRVFGRLDEDEFSDVSRNFEASFMLQSSTPMGLHGY